MCSDHNRGILDNLLKIIVHFVGVEINLHQYGINRMKPPVLSVTNYNDGKKFMNLKACACCGASISDKDQGKENYCLSGICEECALFYKLYE